MDFLRKMFELRLRGTKNEKEWLIAALFVIINP